MWQAIKLTLGSVWGWLGIIVGAISLINLGVMYFEVGIGPVLERVVATYKLVVHQGFDYLFFWVDWKVPPWAKDVAAIYFVFGSAIARSQIIVRRSDTYKFSRVFQYALFFAVVELWPFLFVSALKGRNDTVDDIKNQANQRGIFHFKSADERDFASIHRFKQRLWSAMLTNLVAVPLMAILVVFLQSGL